MKHIVKSIAAAAVAVILTAGSLGLTSVKAEASADSNSWSGIDGLGRELTTDNSSSEKEQKERYVGMFYWTWHSSFYSSTATSNVQKIIEEYPEAQHDYDNAAWNGQTGYMFWNEPIYGYYGGTDQWVMRKQGELLADAGVDFVVFDCTNGTYTWKSGYMALLKAWEAAKADGVNVPKVVFMLNFGSGSDTNTMLKDLWRNLYSKNLYQDLWFYYEGKPLIICHTNSDTSSTYTDFFTIRSNVASYFSKGSTGENQWGWLSTYPQAVYYTADGKAEEISVGVAQNADYKRNCITGMSGYNVMGRSYSYGDYSYSYTYQNKLITCTSDMENSKLYGINFQQQWDYAIEVDPTFVFVTGWNEWVAIRSETWAGDTTLENVMCDEFTDEYSRDVEPSTGDLQDYYYTQLVINIRRYKGTTASASPAAEKTIDINGDISQWADVSSYDSYTTLENSVRNGKGYGNLKLTNDTFRNDITKAKIAYDNDNVYFYVETADEMTDESVSAFMRLFINTDNTDVSPNWESFEYVINRVNPSNGKAVLEKSTGGWNWETVAEVSYVKSGNTLQISVPRSALGVDYDGAPAFTFKWYDNMQNDGEIMDVYNYGDAAPGSRFTYVVGSFTAEHSSSADATTAPSENGSSSEKKGCGSVIISGVSAMVLLSAFVLLRKKRK